MRPPPVLLEQASGAFKASYHLQLFRFLLDDGRTVDVYAAWDDSDLRAALLKATGAKRIEGVAELPVQEQLPEAVA